MNTNKRVEEDILQAILDSESFKNSMRQFGNSDEEARNKATGIVKMDFIEGNWTT